jgi:hypothetical protein
LFAKRDPTQISQARGTENDRQIHRPPFRAAERNLRSYIESENQQHQSGHYHSEDAQRFEHERFPNKLAINDLFPSRDLPDKDGDVKKMRKSGVSGSL